MTARQWLGNVIRMMRRQHGLTLADIGSKARIDRHRVREIELAIGEPVTDAEVGALLRVLLS